MNRAVFIIRKVSALHSKLGLRAKCEMVIESWGIFINEIYRKFAKVSKVQMKAADLITLSRKLSQS